MKKAWLMGLLAAGALSTSAFAQSTDVEYCSRGTANVTQRATADLVAKQTNKALDQLGVFRGYQSASLRLNTTDAMAAVAANGYDCGWLVWANPFGSWSTLDANSSYAGYDLDVYGVNVGIAKQFNNLLVGIGAGYAYGDVDLKGVYGSFNTDNFNVSLYARYTFDRFFADAAVGYMWTWYNDYKVGGLGGVRVKAGDFDGESWFTHLKLGYDFEFCNWVVTPSVAWDYVHADVDAYSLYSAGVWNSRVSSDSNYSSTLPVKLRVARNFTAGQLYAQAGYIREFHESGGSGVIWDGTTYFTGKNRDLAKNYGTVGAGWSGIYRRFDYGASYDYTWASDYDNHTVNLYVGLKF